MDKVALAEAKIDQAAALLQKRPSSSSLAKAHHEADVKDWGSFERNLSSKGFQKAILKHDLSDDKLKEYVKNYGAYLTAKKIVATVPSRTGPHSYDIKRLPTGRLGCNCKDWQYKHSWKNTDCDHIQHYLNKTKTSAAAPYLTRAISAYRAIDSEKTNRELGDLGRGYVAHLKRLKRLKDSEESLRDF